MLVVAISLASGSRLEAADENSQTHGLNGTTVATSEPHLYGVRLLANAETLKSLENAARDAGWTEVRRDRADSIVAIAPEPYDISKFKTLIDGIDAIGVRDFNLQLLGPDGKPVDGNGNPVNEN